MADTVETGEQGDGDLPRGELFESIVEMLETGWAPGVTGSQPPGPEEDDEDHLGPSPVGGGPTEQMIDHRRPGGPSSEAGRGR